MMRLRCLLIAIVLGTVVGCTTPTTPTPAPTPTLEISPTRTVEQVEATSLPLDPTTTPSITPMGTPDLTEAATPTPVATPTFDMDAFFRPVDAPDLQANPKKYENDAFRFTGRVFHLQREGNRTYFQVLTDPAKVNIRAIAVNEGQDMEVGDVVTIYASGFGTSEGVSPSGETVTVPTVEVVKIVEGRR
ncbi:MAG: hypothetical protein ACE5HA_10320 [Anaerolineae bacterium]